MAGLAPDVGRTEAMTQRVGTGSAVFIPKADRVFNDRGTNDRVVVFAGAQDAGSPGCWSGR